MKNLLRILPALALLAGLSCNSGGRRHAADSTVAGISRTDAVSVTGLDSLPPPYATKSVKNYSKVLGWPEDKTPAAPAGFTVTRYAGDLQNPRWIYVAPNGDVLVAEANAKEDLVKKAKSMLSGRTKSGYRKGSADRITLFRDTTGDGLPDIRSVFLQDLNQPFGMLILKDRFYVANTDGLLVFPYQEGATRLNGKGRPILSLPAGGYNNHWTRNIIANADGSKIYISVGSGSNNAEHGMENEVRRANILEINPDGSGERIYASGLRNPVGMGWPPGSQTLWTVVNERDDLGDGLVPDYLTSVQPGAFYGWPYAYLGPHEDPRMKGQKPELVQQTVTPDLLLDPHSASLGLAFYTGNAFPEKYRNGAFIGQRGSWNSSVPTGYKVVFVPFANGQPAGPPEDFLTGFMVNREKNEVYGRPVGVAVAKDGSLLVADDAGNTIWKISNSQRL